MAVEEQSQADEIASLVDAERVHLLGVLERLDQTQWETPSLCTGWTIRHVVSHVLMPYELTLPTFLARMVVRRFAFDRVADDWARRDRRSHPELLEALRRSADRAFNVPGAPAEAPLSHLVAHSEDIYRPLAVSRDVVDRSLNLTLDQLTSPRARGSLTPGLLDSVALHATDTGWRYGDGPQASGTAAALISTITGRTAALDDLSGDGAHLLTERLLHR